LAGRTLNRKKLQLYAAQYYLHVEAFPTYLEELVDRATAHCER